MAAIEAELRGRLEALDADEAYQQAAQTVKRLEAEITSVKTQIDSLIEQQVQVSSPPAVRESPATYQVVPQEKPAVRPIAKVTKTQMSTDDVGAPLVLEMQLNTLKKQLADLQKRLKAPQAKLTEKVTREMEAKALAEREGQAIRTATIETRALFSDPDMLARYYRLVKKAEVAENDYNLNIPRYIDTAPSEETINLSQAIAHLHLIESERDKMRKVVYAYLQAIDSPTQSSESIIPGGWTTVPLIKVVKEFLNGGTPDTSVERYWGGDIPWITGADVIERVIFKTRKYITTEGVENSATNIVPAGNILLVTRTGVGKVAIAGVNIAISQDLTGIVIDEEKAFTEYIFWYLFSRANYLKSLAQGSVIKGVVREDIENIPIVLPPLVEQRRVAEILRAITEMNMRSASAIEQLEQVKHGLMQKLLSGEVRVKVETT